MKGPSSTAADSQLYEFDEEEEEEEKEGDP